MKFQNELLIMIGKGVRPEISRNTPEQLEPLIKKGWLEAPKDRPPIIEFVKCLKDIQPLSVTVFLSNGSAIDMSTPIDDEVG